MRVDGISIRVNKRNMFRESIQHAFVAFPVMESCDLVSVSLG